MKVLAIDDQPEALKQIEKAISAAKGPDKKPYDVVALADHNEALKRLEAERFDVVITDMVMGMEDAEGLRVLEKLIGKSPITIVLTAYPKIPNCVEAMRAGAWDYLEKEPADGSDAYENLLASLKKACQRRLDNPESGRSPEDAKWVQEHLGDLMRDYAGKVVAVLDQKVVGSDTSYGKLRDRVKKAYPVAEPTIVSIPDTEVEAIE